MMIDKRELRIGNLVFVDGHREMFFTILQLKTKVAVIKGISTFQAEYEIITPVQLTRAILEEQLFFGETQMERQVGLNLVLCLSMINDSSQYQLSLMEGQTKKALAGINVDNGFIQSTEYPKQQNNRINLSPIQYLHQLQNTYFEINGRQTV